MPTEAIGEDRGPPVRAEVGQRVEKGLPDDPPPVRTHPELSKGQPSSLQGEKLFLGAIERDLLLVTLPAAPLFGDLGL